MTSYDVVVAGAGPAGAVAALVLARAGRRVLLADRGVTVGASPAALGETLPAAAARLLGDLGLGESFRQGPHLPCYGSVSAWESDVLVAADSLYDPDGCGWRLDRAWFDGFLREAARDAGADVVTAAVRQPERSVGSGSAWTVTLAGREEPVQAYCRWLVDATGRGAAIARRQGGTLRAQDRLTCTLAVFPAGPGSVPAADQDSRTLVEAVPDGWWFTALLPDGSRTAGFLTDADLAAPALRTPAGYLDQLGRARHVPELLAGYGYPLSRPRPPRRLAAAGSRLEPSYGPSWVAAGDAALAVDPLSAQGLLTALYTGLAAGQALHRALDGDRSALAGYQTRLDAIVAAYHRNHREYYGQQTRWPDAPFWRRRSAATSVFAP